MTETEDFSHLSGHKDESVRNLYNQFVIQKEKLEKYESDPIAIFNSALVGAAMEIADRLNKKKIDLDDPYTKAAIALLKDGGKITGAVENGKDAYMKEKDTSTKKVQKALAKDTTVPARRPE